MKSLLGSNTVLLSSFCSQPVLPIEMEFLPECAEDNEPDVEAFVDKMNDMKKGIHGQVYRNSQKAQRQQKENYDRKHACSMVSIVLLTGWLDASHTVFKLGLDALRL